MDSLRQWHEYYVSNSQNIMRHSGNDTGDLTEREKHRIAKSIAAFQLGEYSEGKGLLRAAEAFAATTHNQYLVSITKLFIAEEQAHAMMLARFMTTHHIPFVRKHWADRVFRRLRRDVGFELSITVLITAEIIALVYYQALSASTSSTHLKHICDIIVADELNHVRYESELINGIREGKSRLYRSTIRLLHAVLFLGTTAVVYLTHRSVLNAGGRGPVVFARQCWEEFASRFQHRPRFKSPPEHNLECAPEDAVISRRLGGCEITETD